MNAPHFRAGWWLAALLVLAGGCAPAPAAGAQDTTPAAPGQARTATQPGTATAEKVDPGLPTASPLPATPAGRTGDMQTPTPTSPCTLEFCVEASQFWLSRPIAPPGRQVVDPTYRYGSTQQGAREPHHGVEFLNSFGTPVLAAAAGRVVVAGTDSAIIYAEWPNFYGNLVVLEHEIPGLEAPVFTLYAHLSAILVSPGEQVAPGQQIGEVGLTGVATGSHLHFEVRVGENRYEDTRNPELWLEPLAADDGQLNGALAGRIVNGQGGMVYLDNLVLDRLVGPDREPALFGYLETYADPGLAGQDPWQESFALGDLPAGWYRLTFVYRGLQTRDFEVLPGQVTLVTFTIDD